MSASHAGLEPNEAEDSLVLSGVCAYIGTSQILHDVSLTVPKGKVTVVIGRNGVGKTTTMRAVLGLTRRTGSIRFNDDETIGKPTYRIVRGGVGYVPEDRDVFHDLTIAENLKLAERAGSPPRYELVHGLFPELLTRAKQRAGTLSGGQQQMLSLARALLNENFLLLIDEPTKGLAPRVVTEVVEVLEQARSLSTILMIEQNLAVARRMADRVVVMTGGRVALSGEASLLDEAKNVSSYLGVSERDVTAK